MTPHTPAEHADHAHDHGFDMWANTDHAIRRAFVADYWAALRAVFARSIFTSTVTLG